MKPITKAQLKTIHTLLNQQGLISNKANLVYGFSSGRTESSKELSLSEAKELIQYLKDNDERTSIIKRIWHLGYLSGIIYGETIEDKAMNAAKLNLFTRQRGTIKKDLHQQNNTELKKTLKQFAAIARKKEDKNLLNKQIEQIEKEIQQLVQKEDYEAAAQKQSTLKELIEKYPPSKTVKK